MLDQRGYTQEAFLEKVNNSFLRLRFVRIQLSKKTLPPFV
jgi:hypothetical protein